MNCNQRIESRKGAPMMENKGDAFLGNGNLDPSVSVKILFSEGAALAQV